MRFEQADGWIGHLGLAFTHLLIHRKPRVAARFLNQLGCTNNVESRGLSQAVANAQRGRIRSAV